MISYAQNFEDVILHRVFRDRTDGFYIDVGAMDPTAESVTKFFYDQGWSGINVEPNDWFYSKLLAERPRDINLNVALGDREESKEFHIFERIGNSTFDQASRDRYVERGFEAKSKLVKVTTLASVCRDYVRREIDFLKIDCEGWEECVLRGADWTRFRPMVILVEATEPGTPNWSWSDWEPLLTENARYDMVYFDGLNRFYLRNEYSELRCHFDLPPNVWDDFESYKTYTAEQTVQTLQAEKDSLVDRGAELDKELGEAKQALEERAAEVSQIRSEFSAEIDSMHRELSSAHLRITDLEADLLKKKLWVGQLSQELATSKLR